MPFLKTLRRNINGIDFKFYQKKTRYTEKHSNGGNEFNSKLYLTVIKFVIRKKYQKNCLKFANRN